LIPHAHGNNISGREDDAPNRRNPCGNGIPINRPAGASASAATSIRAPNGHASVRAKSHGKPTAYTPISPTRSASARHVEIRCENALPIPEKKRMANSTVVIA